MSRKELAEAANAVYEGQDGPITENCIGKIEQGLTTFPRAARRAAFRTVLAAATDAEIGFYNKRHRPADVLPNPTRPHDHGLGARESDGGAGGPNIALPVIPSRGIGVGRASRQGRGTVTEPGSAPGQLMPLEIRDNSAASELHSDGEWNSFSLVTGMLAQQRQAVAPEALLSLVEAHRDCLYTLFRKASSDPVRADIGAMLGAASIVASRLWSAQGNRSIALAHCAYARNLADRLGNVGLGATARIFESNLHSDASTLIQADGDVMIGLRLLEEAEAASSNLNPAARARIAAEQAQTYAALQLRSETEAALGRAREAASEITAHDRMGLYSDWTAPRLQVYEGTCRILLGEPDEAVRQLEAATRTLADDKHNINVTLAARVDLSSAYASAGHLEMSCTTLGDAYDELISAGNHRGLLRAQRVRQGLNRWNKERAVRDLDLRIDAA